MRLTKTLRDAYVRAALADVPTTDFDAAISSFILKAVVAALPAPVRKIYDDPNLRRHLRDTYVCQVGDTWLKTSVCVPGDDFEPTPAQIEHVDQLCREKQAQTAMLNRLQTKLRAAAESVNTSEQLATLLPAFERYLPPPPSKTANLPAVRDVVDGFKAAGWPKG